MMGAKPVSESDLETIDKAVKELRIEPDVALEVRRLSWTCGA